MTNHLRKGIITKMPKFKYATRAVPVSVDTGTKRTN